MPSGGRENLHFTLYSICTLQLWHGSKSGALAISNICILDEKDSGKQMTAVHLLHPKFLQSSYVWKEQVGLDLDAKYNFYSKGKFKSFEQV